MNPGKFDTRVQFRRRSIGGDDRRSGPMENFFSTSASWRPLSARALVEAGIDTDAVNGTLVVRDSPLVRQLENEDRAAFNGADCVITSVSIPDRSGLVQIQVERRVGG